MYCIGYLPISLILRTAVWFSLSSQYALAKWILEFSEFLGIKGVNFHYKFGLGIPNHNNSGSKNLEIPRNSQKFPEIPSL